MKQFIAEIRYSVWLYFLPITNPKLAWKSLRTMQLPPHNHRK